ncbi:hypothetical protein MNJPNG_30510 [Cupriavidus oxalaticus]
MWLLVCGDRGCVPVSACCHRGCHVLSTAGDCGIYQELMAFDRAMSDDHRQRLGARRRASPGPARAGGDSRGWRQSRAPGAGRDPERGTEAVGQGAGRGKPGTRGRFVQARARCAQQLTGALERRARAGKRGKDRVALERVGWGGHVAGRIGSEAFRDGAWQQLSATKVGAEVVAEVRGATLDYTASRAPRVTQKRVRFAGCRGVGAAAAADFTAGGLPPNFRRRVHAAGPARPAPGTAASTPPPPAACRPLPGSPHLPGRTAPRSRRTRTRPAGWRHR